MTGRGARPLAEAIDAWQHQLRTVLGDCLPPESRVVLLDVPTTANWGDIGIWLGTRRLLGQLGHHLTGELDDRGFDADRVRGLAGGDGTILLSGGGSLGDIYPARMEHRERVLRELRGCRIVQLTQSIHFEHRDNLERLKRLVGEHGDVHLLIRDVPSLEVARQELDCEAVLCPDLAIGLGHLPLPGPPSVDVLWIHRRGPEAADDGPLPQSDRVLRSDWRPARGHRLANAVDLLVPTVQRRLYDAGTDLAEPLRRRLVPLVPRPRMRLARRFLGQGRVIVTDRLHGHILAMLAGVPHVLLDNRIGKLRAFHDTWSAGVEGVHFAEGPQHALEIATSLVDER